MRVGDNIRLRSDGRYEARYIKSRTDTGRAIYGSCYGRTYEEASAKRQAILDQQFAQQAQPQGLNLLILGAGDLGQEVYEIAHSMRIFHKIDFLDDDPDRTAAIGKWTDIDHFTDQYSVAIPAIGDGQLRRKWFYQLVKAGYSIPTIVHSSALVAGEAEIGIGSILGPRTTVSPGARIGMGCVISPSATIGRGAQLEDWKYVDEGGIVREI